MHTAVGKQLENLIKAKPHAIGLIGPFGAGKRHLADWLACQLLEKPLIAGAIYAVQPDNGSIGIEAIRKIRNYIKLKTTGKSGLNRLIIIEDAQSLTLEAQNALLKSLEEPPSDTGFILTLAGENSILPTVLSRLQKVTVAPVSQSLFSDTFKDKFATEKINRAYAVSGGYMGLAAALLGEGGEQINQSIADAKRLLGQTTYERLLIVDELTKDKSRLRRLFYSLKRVLSAAIRQSIAKDNRTSADRLIRSLDKVVAAEASLYRNPNVKLMLSDLLINL